MVTRHSRRSHDDMLRNAIRSEKGSSPMGSRRIRLGSLPGHTAEDDYPRMTAMIGPEISTTVVHTPGEETSLDEAVLRDDRRSPAVTMSGQELKTHGVDAAMWACTSGSFLFGLRGRARAGPGARRHRRRAYLQHLPCFCCRCRRAWTAPRRAVASPYPDDIAQAFRRFMADAGVDVVHVASLNTTTAHEIGDLRAGPGACFWSQPVIIPTPTASSSLTRRFIRWPCSVNLRRPSASPS